MSQLTNWSSTIRDACWLKLWLDQHERDLADEESGLEIYTAIDASVASLYSEPVLNEHHAHLLGKLRDNILADLAFTLGHLTLRHSRPKDRPMVLLPGHDEEFLSVFAAIQGERRQRFRRAIPTLTDLYSRVQVPVELRSKAIEEQDVERTAEFIGGEFQLLHGLPRKRQFDVVRWYDFIGRSAIRASAELDFPQPDQDDLASLKELWFDKIRGEKIRSRSILRLDRDAEALANLGLINQLLADTGDKRRLVLVTLDVALQTAALKNLDLPGAEYLRDPRQYVGLLPSSVGTFVHDRGRPELATYGIKEWLSVVLSPLQDDDEDEIPAARLVTLAEDHPEWRDIIRTFTSRARRKNFGQMPVFDTEWNSFIRLGINRYGTEHLTDDPGLQAIANAVESDEAGLQAALTQYVVGVLSDASVLSIIAGIYLSVSRTGADTLKLRMPVAILSPDPEQNALYISSVDAVAGGRELSVSLIPKDFKGKYVAHLSFGAYFAAIGNWEAAETLATAALAFVDGQDDTIRSQMPQPVGDEAAYLLAVAQRHRLRSPKDLERASASLDEFEARHARSGTSRANPRASVERAAQKLNRAFATHFLGDSWASDDPFDPEATIASLAAAEAELDGLGDEVFRRLVRKQIYAILTGIGVLNILSGDAPEGLSRIALERGCGALMTLFAVEYGDTFLERASRSRYITIIMGFGLLYEGRKVDREQLMLLLEQAQSEPPEMPYDRPMYQAIARRVAEMGREAQAELRS